MPRRYAPGRGRDWAIGLLLFACILSGYLLSFNVDQPTHNGDWYIRYQVTCSIVERNAFYIYRYSPDARVGPGVHGRNYAQYTLGQTTAMIPLYLLGRVLAGLTHTNCDAVLAPPIVFLTCKSLDLILGALLGVLFFHTARLLRFDARQALALTALLAFGTSLWPDVLSNLEHTMESLFLLVAAYAALRYTLQRRKSRFWIAVMGVAAGLVFVTRLSGIIALPIFSLYLLVLHRRWRPDSWREPFRRDLALFVACLLPSFLINAVFDALRFGSPLRTAPYPDHSFGYPPWFGIPNLLLSPGKGLLWYTPALLLLLPAARPFWRRYPLPAILFGLICGVYMIFYANVSYWHGDPAWGPRYLYPLLPYLILPLGEVSRRWHRHRLPLRGLVVGSLAASFLVQLAGVTVSYWRYWHWLFGYHYDEIRRYVWGFNFNNWWYPDQSPIAIALAGVANMTRTFVAHAPLVGRPIGQRLSTPIDACVFAVYRHASICLGDVDKLHYDVNLNTFTMWWMHTYPWWNQATVIALALALVVVFLLSGGGLLALLPRRPRPSAPSGRQATARAVSGLAPLGTAALIAGAVYGVVVGVAAASAPRHAPPLVRVVTPGATVRNGAWAYRVLGLDRVGTLPGDLIRPEAGHHYVTVRLRLSNLSARANGVPPGAYGLVDAGGQEYPWALTPDGAAIVPGTVVPFTTTVPARTTVDRALIAQIPDGTRHLAVLGPGVTLIPLG